MRDREEEDGYRFGSAIVTGRLLLRPPDAADRAAVAALAANPRVAENLAAAPGERADQPSGSFAVIERESGIVVGGAAFGPIADRPGAVEVAAFLGEPFWGRGFATEAAQALIDGIFADRRVRVLRYTNRASNTRARRVVEKCGFQFRGNGMVRSPALKGAVPVERFLLDRRNWESLKAWGAGRPGKGHSDAPRDNAA